MKRLHTKAGSARASALVVALLLLVMPACGAAQTPLAATVSAPDATAALKVNEPVNIIGQATGNGLKSVDVFVDGTKHATVDTPAQPNQFVISAPWTPTKAGAHVIQLKGLDDKGEVLVASEAVFVNVQGQSATPTVEPTVPPTIAPTVAPPVASTVAVSTTTPTTATAATTQVPTASVKEGDFVNVRKGPAVAYDKLGTLDKGQSAPVRGKSADGTWWQITFPASPDGIGWVIGQLVNISGDTSGVPVAQAPPLPTAGATTQPATTNTPAPAATTTSSMPASALLPYSQSMRFSPRDNIGDVPLGFQGESKSSTLVWEVNGAKSLELEITAVPGTGIYQNCPAGNLSTITPNDAVGKRKPLSVPSGSYPFTINGQGYYVFTIHVVKTDGSSTTIPRAVIVDCYKTQ
jgi:uncharacterized protein YraI